MLLAGMLGACPGPSPRATARQGAGATTDAGAATSTGATSDHAPGEELARTVDLHVDLAYALHVRGRRIDDPGADASLDRLVRGRVGRVVIPLFVPDAWRMEPARVREEYAATLETLVRALGSEPASRVLSLPGAPARSDRVATLLAFEGADGFADDPAAIGPWIRRGACLVGLVHDRSNALAGSSQEPAAARRLLGLTPAGRAVARAVYESGGLVDVAHASDAAFDEIAAIAASFSAPLVDSHTGARALREIDRNLDDARLTRIASSGGVVGVDLHSGHIGSTPGMPASLDDLVAHVEHVARVAGEHHVAVGSDLEGGITAPEGADGAATWPLLARRLTRRGWSRERIDALLRDNADRVLRRCAPREKRADGSPWAQ